jgi:hypothetical protein
MSPGIFQLSGKKMVSNQKGRPQSTFTIQKVLMKNHVFVYSLVITMLVFHYVNGQERYQLLLSKLSFVSKAPLENIEATNYGTRGIIDPLAKSFFFRIPIKEFDFHSDLMEEHFNENYLESGKFPYATFKGTIENTVSFKTDGIYAISAKGELNIHGVSEEREISATISVKGDKITIESQFNVRPEDHRIKIPSILFNKIAQDVRVAFYATCAVIQERH